MSAAALGRVLWAVHLTLAALAFGLTMFGPAALLPYLSVFWVLMLTMYVVNRGCVITHLEQYLTGDDITIVDPFLTALRLPTSTRNRNILTLLGGTTMLLVTLARFNKSPRQ